MDFSEKEIILVFSLIDPCFVIILMPSKFPFLDNCMIRRKAAENYENNCIYPGFSEL